MIQYVCEDKYQEVTNESNYSKNVSIAIIALDAARYQTKLGLEVCMWSNINQLANLGLRLDQLSLEDAKLIAESTGLNLSTEEKSERDGNVESDDDELVNELIKTKEELDNANSPAVEREAYLVFDSMVIKLQKNEKMKMNYRAQHKRNDILTKNNKCIELVLKLTCTYILLLIFLIKLI